MMVHCNKTEFTRLQPDHESVQCHKYLRSKRMKAPKILPWIAHRTGISEVLALKLWRRAAGEAEVMTGCCDSSDYYRLAVERFIDFAEAEGGRAVVRETRGAKTCISWLWRHQHRVSKLNLIMAQCLARLWQSNVNSLFGVRQHAA